MLFKMNVTILLGKYHGYWCSSRKCAKIVYGRKIFFDKIKLFDGIFDSIFDTRETVTNGEAICSHMKDFFLLEDQRQAPVSIFLLAFFSKERKFGSCTKECFF